MASLPAYELHQIYSSIYDAMNIEPYNRESIKAALSNARSSLGRCYLTVIEYLFCDGGMQSKLLHFISDVLYTPDVMVFTIMSIDDRFLPSQDTLSGMMVRETKLFKNRLPLYDGLVHKLNSDVFSGLDVMPALTVAPWNFDRIVIDVSGCIFSVFNLMVREWNDISSEWLRPRCHFSKNLIEQKKIQDHAHDIHVTAINNTKELCTRLEKAELPTYVSHSPIKDAINWISKSDWYNNSDTASYAETISDSGSVVSAHNVHKQPIIGSTHVASPGGSDKFMIRPPHPASTQSGGGGNNNSNHSSIKSAEIRRDVNDSIPSSSIPGTVKAENKSTSGSRLQNTDQSVTNLDA